MANSKPCPSCGQDKSLDQFRKNSSKKLGVSSYCKQCLYLSEKAARERRSENQKERARRNSNNWYHKHKPNNNESTKRYLDANPGLRSHYLSRYRAAKKLNGIFYIRKSELSALLRGCCFYCGQKNVKITLDHVIPISRGGTHSIGNLVACCLRCNSSKGNKFITEWKKGKKCR
jgi:5-methylcytosine-specific restriction endonuclease McrA